VNNPLMWHWATGASSVLSPAKTLLYPSIPV
jgi:hypothetical protein